MNSKVLVAALAVLALQALNAHGSSIGVADGDLNQALDRVLDLSDKEVLTLINNGLNLDDGDLSLSSQKLQVSKQSLDIGIGILQAIQNILNGINVQIQNSYNAVLGAITTAIQNAQKVTQSAVDSWTQNLQNVIDAANAYDSTVAACQAAQPTLQSVSEALNADVRACVQDATASAQAALQQLEDLRPETDTLLQNARQAIADCQPQGLMAPWCLAGKTPPLILEATGLAANATRLGAHVTGQLVLAVPLQNAACVGGAVTTRGREAAAITEAIRQCVQDGLRPATAAP